MITKILTTSVIVLFGIFCAKAQTVIERKNPSVISNEIEKRELQLKEDNEILDSLKKVEEKAISDSIKKLDSKISSLKKLRSDLKPEEDKKPNSRISFVVGLGGSYSLDNVYQMPVVSTLDNQVKMEMGQRERLTATLGIVYTPYIWKVSDFEHPEGFLVAKGWSFVGFFNPLSVLKNSNLEDNFSLSNFGFGAGWKFASGVGIYAVYEMYSIKQPRQWFIDEFKNGDKEYKVNNYVQSSFSSDDNNIFRSKLIPSIGIKVCYSFDIIKSFASSKGDQF